MMTEIGELTTILSSSDPNVSCKVTRHVRWWQRPFYWFSAVASEVAQKKRDVADRVREREGGEEDRGVDISYGRRGDAPGARVLAPVVGIVLRIAAVLDHLRYVFATGTLAQFKAHSKWMLLVLVVCVLVQRNINTARQAEIALDEERKLCHTGIDTTTPQRPPCRKLNEKDFTSCNVTLTGLQRLMENHVTADGHSAIASFHVGGNACIMSVQGYLKAHTYFNPELPALIGEDGKIVNAQPATTVPSGASANSGVRIMKEPSDYFPGVVLLRKRPKVPVLYPMSPLSVPLLIITIESQAVIIEHWIYDKTLQGIKPVRTQFNDVYAAAVLHTLEVLRGTHHLWYQQAMRGELNVSAPF